jgi:acetoin:2,6-dichlorophenolindophenol oxidoreductase subunit beta
MNRTLSYGQAINEAVGIAMEEDRNVICFGLGVDDPKAIFGTTGGLAERFGPQRVFDTPISENALTGIAIGASLDGIRPVMTHQRLDFFLLAMDQLVNNAAKWRYMFGGQRPVPITIRLILGRGWGQGPQHSQNLHSWFAHIPGLKVVMPATAYDAKGLLLASIRDDNPVVFLEHRWLHNLEGEVPEGDYTVALDRAQLLRRGDDVTIVALSYMTIEALHAVDHLEKHGVRCDLVDLRSVNPIDWDTVLASVRRTGRLIALDTASRTLSVASEIVSRASIECFDALKAAPAIVALPDHPTPTSPALSEGYYRRAEDIVAPIARMLGREIPVEELKAARTSPHDVPGAWFKGPF